jgi:hypothetical protein
MGDSLVLLLAVRERALRWPWSFCPCGDRNTSFCDSGGMRSIVVGGWDCHWRGVRNWLSRRWGAWRCVWLGRVCRRSVVLWLRCRERRGSSRGAVRGWIHSRRRDRCGRIVQSRWIDRVCTRIGGSGQLRSLRTRVGIMMAAIGSSGDLAKLMGMRLAKALLIVCRNSTDVDREVLSWWCISAIQRALESGADSGGLLLAMVRSRSGRENIEQLLCCTCE